MEAVHNRWACVLGATALLVAVAPVRAQNEDNPTPEAAPGDLGTEKAEAYFQQLVTALREDASFKVRLQAAVFLGRSDDERAFEPLIAAMSSDENYTVRAAAANALANLQEPRAISHIIKRIATDSDPFVRAEAREALDKYDRDEAIPYVVAAFGSDNAAVRKEAAAYVAESPDSSSQAVLIRALGDSPEIFEVVRTTALRMKPEEALNFLEQALDHREAAVRTGAVRVLHALGTKEAAELIRKVYERDIEADGVRKEGRIALRDLRAHLDVDAIVADATTNPQKHLRAKALKLLGVIGGDEAKKVLLASLDDQDVYLRGTAVMALGDLGDSSVIPALQSLEKDQANKRILHLIEHAVRNLGAPDHS